MGLRALFGHRHEIRPLRWAFGQLVVANLGRVRVPSRDPHPRRCDGSRVRAEVFEPAREVVPLAVADVFDGTASERVSLTADRGASSVPHVVEGGKRGVGSYQVPPAVAAIERKTQRHVRSLRKIGLEISLPHSEESVEVGDGVAGETVALQPGESFLPWAGSPDEVRRTGCDVVQRVEVSKRVVAWDAQGRG